MSSRACGVAISSVLVLGGLQLFAQSNKNPNTLTCPASITVTENTPASPPWRSEPATTQHKFLRPSIYNGTRGKQEYELAPDRTEAVHSAIVQTWMLSDYRYMNIFVRCRYENTEATVSIDLPSSLKTCTFSFHNSAKKDSLSAQLFECK